MPTTFANIYPNLCAAQHQPNAFNLAGLWLAHGDEPLIIQWFSQAIIRLCHQQQLTVKRVELTSVKSWQEALDELSSLSLFAEATTVMVTGSHKPDKHTQNLLNEFAQNNNQNALIWLTGRLDKYALQAKWAQVFIQYGQIVDCQLYNEQQRQQLLTYQAQQFGLRLSNEAWQLLIAHTEQNLLSAYQTLWRLSYLFADKLSALEHSNTSSNSPNSALALEAEDLQAALVSDSQFSVFDLTDAMLSGDAQQVIKIINQLEATAEPLPLVLWTLAKDMRLIMQLVDGQNVQALGIWRSKQPLYIAASRRQTKHSIRSWSNLLYRCDQAIKGVINQPAWQIISQAALLVAGISLFS